MVETLLAVGPLFFLLVLSELLWRVHLLRGEAARKLLHIIIGSYVASWPYFMSFKHIQLLSLAMLVVVCITHRFRVFHAISNVKRKTWGDILYALGLVGASLLTQEPWVFALAVLHMSVADGLAGLVGSHYGKGNTYKIFGSTKSLVGTATFVVASFVLLALFRDAHAGSITPLVAVALPFGTAALENIGARGSDNVMIPLFIVLLFR